MHDTYPVYYSPHPGYHFERLKDTENFQTFFESFSPLCECACKIKPTLRYFDLGSLRYCREAHAFTSYQSSKYDSTFDTRTFINISQDPDMQTVLQNVAKRVLSVVLSTVLKDEAEHEGSTWAKVHFALIYKRGKVRSLHNDIAIAKPNQDMFRAKSRRPIPTYSYHDPPGKLVCKKHFLPDSITFIYGPLKPPFDKDSPILPTLAFYDSTPYTKKPFHKDRPCNRAYKKGFNSYRDFLLEHREKFMLPPIPLKALDTISMRNSIYPNGTALLHCSTSALQADTLMGRGKANQFFTMSARRKIRYKPEVEMRPVLRVSVSLYDGPRYVTISL